METAPTYATGLTPGGDLPLYLVRKTVRAGLIVAIHPDPHGDVSELEFEDGKRLPVTTDWLQRRCGPRSPVGGYFIVYTDGYTSWSPEGPFKASATRLPEGS